MNILSSSWRFLAWFGAVMRVFFSTRPLLTNVLVISKALSSITRILAFFIPLKVLLLIATPGVPRYFRFFIEPELRMEWAVGLSIAAVVAYFLTIALDKLAERLSDVGSRELLVQASQMAVFGNQRELAKRYFADFTGVAVNMLLTATLLGLGLWLYPTLFAVLLAAFTVQFVATGLVLRRLDEAAPAGLSGYIHGNLPQYLSYLEAFNFLLVFAFLVADFLFFDGVNILIAILSFLMARRVLPSVSAIFADATTLLRQRHRIDPLVFADQKYLRKEPEQNQKLTHYFRVDHRETRLLGQLRARLGDVIVRVESRWVDPGPSGVSLFSVHAHDSDDRVCFHGQEQVSGVKRREALDNEALIVDEVGREPLCMAPTLQEFRLGAFECRLLDIGETEPVTGAAWKKHHMADFMAKLWCVEPSSRLRGIFELSRDYLGNRVSEKELARMEVALDTDEKRATRDALRVALPQIREIVAKLPVFPLNKGLNPALVFSDESGRLRVTDWCKWSLEPVGVGLGAGQIVCEHARAVSHARPGTDLVDHRAMGLASRLYEFEELLMARGKYNEALEVAEKMLNDLAELSGRIAVGDTRGLAGSAV